MKKMQIQTILIDKKENLIIQNLKQIDQTGNTIIQKEKYQFQPLKVVVIGLSYTGKKLVAQFLEKFYGFQRINFDNQTVQTSKNVAKLCFDNYEGRGVYVLEKANYQVLKTLKKRNFVNVICVEASILKRYFNYLSETQIPDTEDNLRWFLDKDDKQNDEEYQKCLQFVKTRICNRQDLQFLIEQILQKKDQIIKPFRPSWEDYFMKIADIARRRSNCMKSSVGAVIINSNNRVLSTGYNGTPKGLLDCFKNGCQRCNFNSSKSLDQCFCLHAEESAIIEVGIKQTEGCHLYTTLYPCFNCAKVIKQAGITKIFYFQDYDKEDSGKAFLEKYFDAEKDIKQVKIDNIYY